MKSLCRWASMIWLSASVVFAQGPADETPRLDLAKAAVTVVFAPDYGLASQPQRSLRSLETPPARILSFMTGHRGGAAADTIGFAARKGLMGIRTGAESVMATVVTAGEGGRPKFSCFRLPHALERLQSAGKDATNDR
jgi:hypothetical protein